MAEEWYRHSFRRNLVDMHIADWDEQFLFVAPPLQTLHMFALDY